MDDELKPNQEKIISKITPPAWTAPLPGFIPHQLQEIKKILEK
jgi:hypothetical protein